MAGTIIFYWFLVVFPGGGTLLDLLGSAQTTWPFHDELLGFGPLAAPTARASRTTECFADLPGAGFQLLLPGPTESPFTIASKDADKIASAANHTSNFPTEDWRVLTGEFGLPNAALPPLIIMKNS